MRILTVEDEPQHARDAAAYFQERPFVTMDHVSTYMAFADMMGKGGYDGIISDVFFPWDDSGWNAEAKDRCCELLKGIIEGYRSDSLRYSAYLNAIRRWNNGEEMHPTGIIVADESKKAKIPVVLCTSTYHHGIRTEPVNMFCREKRVPLVDAKPDDIAAGEAPAKNWDRAFAHIVAPAEALPMAPELREMRVRYNEGTGKSDQIDARREEMKASLRDKLAGDYKVDDKNAGIVAGQVIDSLFYRR